VPEGERKKQDAGCRETPTAEVRNNSTNSGTLLYNVCTANPTKFKPRKTTLDPATVPRNEH